MARLLATIAIGAVAGAGTVWWMLSADGASGGIGLASPPRIADGDTSVPGEPIGAGAADASSASDPRPG